MRQLLIAAAVAAFAGGFVSAQAQERVRVPGPDIQTFHFEAGAPPPEGGPVNTFRFMSAEFGMAGKAVKGAPYQADAVTETVQTLADGNRIMNKSTVSVARDSEGRTRREQTLGAIGPWANAGDPPKFVFISDPVAGVSYMLDPNLKVARKSPILHMQMPPKEAGIAVAGVAAGGPVSVAAENGKTAMVIRRMTTAAPGREAQTEQLGQQTIEGVVADGTRTTFTIPAGEVGNEKPIQVVDERWYSPELQTVIMSKNTDPRMGESTYKLTHISRAEPAASLFEVPSDYQVTDMKPMQNVEYRIKK